MLLAVDIGNTNIAFGAYDGHHLKADFRMSTGGYATADEAGLAMEHLLKRKDLSPEDIDKFVLACVVPPLTAVFESVAVTYFDCRPVVVSHQSQLPIRVEIDQPEQIGADRIANAAAGFAGLGGPIIIVDFGTATTFDVVDGEGAYIGGVIIPGPASSIAELAKKAARLFEVPIAPPERVVGKSTSGALQSGLFYGTVGQVDYIIEKIIQESGFEECIVVATGGLASGIEHYSRHIRQSLPALTLEGLRIIGEQN